MIEKGETGGPTPTTPGDGGRGSGTKNERQASQRELRQQCDLARPGLVYALGNCQGENAVREPRARRIDDANFRRNPFAQEVERNRHHWFVSTAGWGGRVRAPRSRAGRCRTVTTTVLHGSKICTPPAVPAPPDNLLVFTIATLTAFLQHALSETATLWWSTVIHTVVHTTPVWYGHSSVVSTKRYCNTRVL